MKIGAYEIFLNEEDFKDYYKGQYRSRLPKTPNFPCIIDQHEDSDDGPYEFFYDLTEINNMLSALTHAAEKGNKIEIISSIDHPETVGKIFIIDEIYSLKEGKILAVPADGKGADGRGCVYFFNSGEYKFV